MHEKNRGFTVRWFFSGWSHRDLTYKYIEYIILLGKSRLFCPRLCKDLWTSRWAFLQSAGKGYRVVFYTMKRTELAVSDPMITLNIRKDVWLFRYFPIIVPKPAHTETAGIQTIAKIAIMVITDRA